jgi:hypothetical protein
VIDPANPNANPNNFTQAPVSTTVAPDTPSDSSEDTNDSDDF